jgi:tryptophan-rich sensory protein
MTRNYKSLIIFFLIIITIQVIGGLVTASSVNSWYTTIQKPSFNPPDWVFGPVWTALYIMITISGWMVWNKLEGSSKTKLKTPQMKLYGAQLLANFLWTMLFFGLHNPLLGLIDITALLLLILLTIKSFLKVSKIAAYMLIPYSLWVAFACVLNYNLVALN